MQDEGKNIFNASMSIRRSDYILFMRVFAIIQCMPLTLKGAIIIIFILTMSQIATCM